MPFDIDLINDANRDELLTICFSNEDFDNTNELTKLKNILKSFKKLTFKLQDECINKAPFIDFVTQLLDGHPMPQLVEFDLSNNNLTLEKTEDVQTKTKRRARFQKSNDDVVREKLDGLVKHKLFSVQYLNRINLEGNSLFSEASDFQNIRFAILRGCQKINLKNTFFKSRRFSLKQLSMLVRPFSKMEKENYNLDARESSCEIIVSVTQLPEILCKQITDTTDSIDLQTIREMIVNSYRKECFETQIDLIRKSSSTKIISVSFEPIVEFLTDDETQKLAEVLGEPTCKISTLNLPPCNFSFLVAALKKHSSLVQLNVSRLGSEVQLIDGLIEVFSSNSKIRFLKCEWQIFLTSEFEKFVESISQNTQSKLHYSEKNNNCIELVEGEVKLKDNLQQLMILISKAKNHSEHKLKKIRIVIDLSTTVNMELLKLKLNNQFSEEEICEKEQHLLFLSKDQNPKLILTPCYDTHSIVMNHIDSLLKDRLKEISEEEEQQDDSYNSESDEDDQESSFGKALSVEPLPNPSPDISSVEGVSCVTPKNKDGNEELAKNIASEIKQLVENPPAGMEESGQQSLSNLKSAVGKALKDPTPENIRVCLEHTEEIDRKSVFGKKLIGLLLAFVGVLAIAAGIVLSMAATAATFGLAAPLTVPAGVAIASSGAILASGGAFLFFHDSCKNRSSETNIAISSPNPL